MNQHEPSDVVVNQASAAGLEAPDLDTVTPKPDQEMVDRFDKIYRDMPADVAEAIDSASQLDLTETEAVDTMLLRMPRISDFVTEATVAVDVVAGTYGADTADVVEALPIETTAERAVTAAGLATAMADLGLNDIDPDQDVSAELAALSEEDQQKMQSLREMSAAEGLPMTDAQLLTFLKRIKSLNESVKKLKPVKRQVDHKIIAKRRAQAKAADRSRKRNRGR